MRIIHFSDWHGSFQKLPPGDVYVCTGDMYPNFPELICEAGAFSKGTQSYIVGQDKIPMFVRPIGRKIHPDWEKKKQLEFAAENNIRSLMGNPDAPVICVKGNHDFISLSHLFLGGETYEIIEPEDVFTVYGKRFGGMRGINYIIGEWDDETFDFDAEPRARRIPPDLDVLITHAPPAGVLDYAGDHYGMRAIRNYLDRADYAGRRLWHLFGHVHQSFGTGAVGETIMVSNAATGYHELSI